MTKQLKEASAKTYNRWGQSEETQEREDGRWRRSLWRDKIKLVGLAFENMGLLCSSGLGIEQQVELTHTCIQLLCNSL